MLLGRAGNWLTRTHWYPRWIMDEPRKRVRGRARAEDC